MEGIGYNRGTVESVTLYALMHPEKGDVRYIGKTTNTLTQRLSGHLCEAKTRGKNRRCTWIRSLSARPSIVPILVTDARYASAAERFAIALFRAAGDDLVNGTDGGEGTYGKRGHQSAEHRAAIGAANSRSNRGKKPWSYGKKFSPEYRATLSLAHLGSKHSAETRVRMALSQRQRRERERQERHV